MSKTNIGLVAYCKEQVGRPYWFGTFGQVADRWLLDYNKSRFPGTYANPDYERQLGQRVHDCSGLIKGYMWSDSPDGVPKYGSGGFPDMDADTMRNKCGARPISTLPEMPGVLVFMADHVGVYIGGGEVIEARGHAYGVVRTKLKERGWMYWGYLPGVEYKAAESEKTGKYDKVRAWAKENGITDDRNITFNTLVEILQMMEETEK